MDFHRTRTTPRVHSSDPADRVKPHRIARAAARTLVARGVLEGEPDMPSLTSMGKRDCTEGEDIKEARFALRAEVASDSDSGSESRLEEGSGACEIETCHADEEQEQPPQQEPEQKPVQNETRVEREFVGRILDFELRRVESISAEMHEGVPSIADPEPVERDWEVLPQVDSHLANDRRCCATVVLALPTSAAINLSRLEMPFLRTRAPSRRFPRVLLATG
eukprot:CAMPEP_0115348936 /NCGR_PEP_ID=MMETSP0270-20121206/95661_1 /TAXON_ID=71861 /ORGANISM="Scrippsiella trochoidea, Strain CCMP3099" /LENGTH=220 /DNA_ID=CAMNT_0002770921 /DNA_START=1 /DNA_END=659 /DNA_ORIENTATION=+